MQWTNGGTHPNPFDTGTLSGAGDLLLFLLEQITEDIDRDEWNAARPILNQYKFAGYVNDDKITILEFIQKNIIAYLPISIVNAGPKGLRPVFSMYADGIELQPRVQITAGPEFFRTGPIMTKSGADDVINNCVIRFAKNGITNSYTTKAIARHRESPFPRILFSLHPLARISKQRYGTKIKVFELDYCYDGQTAIRIARNMVSMYAAPQRTIEYVASIEYGYLQIGDIIMITDADLQLQNHFMQIVSKTFNADSFLFELLIYDNALTVEKSI